VQAVSIELLIHCNVYRLIVSTALLPRFRNRCIILISRHHEIAIHILYEQYVQNFDRNVAEI
jgi:hypothetical protein